MEFMVTQSYFSKAIASVSHIVASKSSIPILSGIKLIADHSGLTLIGSNSEMGIEYLLPQIDDQEDKLEVYSYGSIVVPAQYLSEIVKKLPGNILFKLTGTSSIVIQSEGVITKLNGINSEEYPNLPDVKLQNSISISNKMLIETIRQTIFAVSSNDSRPVLSGVNMAFGDDKLICVATNSHRLALKELEVGSSINESIVVPYASLKELIKLMVSQDSKIHMYFSKKYIVFKTNSVRLFSRLIEGNYPEITRLIPKKSKTVLTLDLKRFLQGIDRACLLASESKNNNVRLNINGDEKLTISSNQAEIGTIEETQIINTIYGNTELTLSLDGSFLMDALKTIKTNEIKISMGGSMSPVLIEPVDSSTYIHLISPVRT